MKYVIITFCILTIIMQIALMISIINNDSKEVSLKEKKYTLLILASFILLMISNIFSTLNYNKIAITLLVVFFILIIYTAIKYYLYRKNKEYRLALLPDNIKYNTLITKEIEENNKYKVSAKLLCCNDKFKIHSLKEDNINILKCECVKCHKVYELHNSELYNPNQDIKVITEEFQETTCSLCNSKTFEVNLLLEYNPSTRDGNNYNSIIVNTTCNKCHHKEKELYKYEK